MRKISRTITYILRTQAVRKRRGLKVQFLVVLRRKKLYSTATVILL